MKRADLEALAVELAPLVLAQIAKLAANVTPAEWLARRGCPRPPGYSVDAWMALAKKIGMKRGRWYVVSAGALADHEGRAESPTTPSTWSAASALKAAGVRGTR